MKHDTTLLTAVIAFALGAGCTNTEPMNIGDVGVLGAELSDYAGTWEGYAEAYQFADDSDVVRLMLDADGSGVLEVGDSDPLPEPDPTHGYPPAEIFDDGITANLVPEGKVLPGFSYPVAGAVVEDHRIRLALGSTELFRGWCEGMSPVLDQQHLDSTGEEAYFCLRNDSTTTGDDGCFLGDDPIDCGLFACMNVCRCDAEGCSVDDVDDVRFDGALEEEGAQLVGTLVVGDRLTVRLTRL